MNFRYFFVPNIAIRLGLSFALAFIFIVLPSVTVAESEDITQNKKSFGTWEQSEEAKEIKENVPEDYSSSGKSKNKGSRIFPTVWCSDITDSDTEKICWKSYREGLKYYERGLPHRTRVIEWQHISTLIIFFVVLFLVGTGIYFAWVQFKAGATSSENNEIEISLTGVKVSSPVLGVIILVISLAFFYLYLRYVYPISEII